MAFFFDRNNPCSEKPPFHHSLRPPKHTDANKQLGTEESQIKTRACVSKQETRNTEAAVKSWEILPFFLRCASKSLSRFQRVHVQSKHPIILNRNAGLSHPDYKGAASKMFVCDITIETSSAALTHSSRLTRERHEQKLLSRRDDSSS